MTASSALQYSLSAEPTKVSATGGSVPFNSFPSCCPDAPCRLALVDAGELVAVELGDGRIVGSDELVGPRLGDLAHARLLRRRDLVELHALGLQLADRLLRRGADDRALVGARLVGSIVHDLLLGRRQLVPEALADQDDVRGVDVVG